MIVAGAIFWAAMVWLGNQESNDDDLEHGIFIATILLAVICTGLGFYDWIAS